MTTDQKTNYLRIALGIQGIAVNNQTSELIISTYEEIINKKGGFTIDDATNIQLSIERKYKQQKLNEVNNQKSEDKTHT